MAKMNKNKTKQTKIYIHADRNGIASFPWMLLIATTCPEFRLIMSGSNAAKDKQLQLIQLLLSVQQLIYVKKLTSLQLCVKTM